MHQIYSGDSENWDLFLENQIGGSFFEGELYRRGNQIGFGLFSNVLTYLIPIAKKIGKEIGMEGLELGSNVLSQLAKGESLTPTLTKETKKSAKKLINLGKSKIQVGGRQSIVGRRLKKVDLNLNSADPFIQYERDKKNRCAKRVRRT